MTELKLAHQWLGWREGLNIINIKERECPGRGLIEEGVTRVILKFFYWVYCVDIFGNHQNGIQERNTFESKTKVSLEQLESYLKLGSKDV